MSTKRYIKLRLLLEERGIRHKDMAKVLGMNASTFSQKINRNRSSFNVEEAAKIAKHLDVSMDEIFLS